MTVNRTGVALIISAPSGTGKSTLVRMLHREHPDLTFSVSYTTRAPRKNEQDGKDYYFVSEKEFLSLKEDTYFAEWAKVHDHYYGTPLQKTLDSLENGKDIVFDIDVQGAFQLKHNLGQGCFIFLFPPSFEELQKRLRKRGTETDTSIQKRLQNAREEIKHAPFFDHWIINDRIEDAYDTFRSIYISEQCRASRYPELINSVLSTWKD